MTIPNSEKTYAVGGFLRRVTYNIFVSQLYKLEHNLIPAMMKNNPLSDSNSNSGHETRSGKTVAFAKQE